jgi:hypothetical protein
MLDTLIAYKLVQYFVLGLVCCVNKQHENSRPVVILVHKTGSTWYNVLYQYAMYLMDILISGKGHNFFVLRHSVYIFCMHM